jgi:hypothetical protein
MKKGMKLIKHNNFIYEYENFVSYEDCDLIVDLVESCPDILSKYKSVKSKIRNNQAIPLTELASKSPLINEADILCHDIISACSRKYCNDNLFVKKFSYILDKNERFSSKYIYRFYDKNDYYDWHIDESNDSYFVLSIIMYLNDDFEGGSTLFLTDKLKVTPKKGSILVFPCDLRTIHKGTKVTSGTKKIIWTCTEREMC